MAGNNVRNCITTRIKYIRTFIEPRREILSNCVRKGHICVQSGPAEQIAESHFWFCHGEWLRRAKLDESHLVALPERKKLVQKPSLLWYGELRQSDLSKHLGLRGSAYFRRSVDSKPSTNPREELKVRSSQAFTNHFFDSELKPEKMFHKQSSIRFVEPRPR